MDIVRINFHLLQAKHYNLAIADPAMADYDTMRLIRRHATYHLAMADWLVSEPEQPPVTPIIRQHFVGATDGEETSQDNPNNQDDGEAKGQAENDQGNKPSGEDT